MGNHSRPTPSALLLSLFLYVHVYSLVGRLNELGPGSYPDFLSFFRMVFFWQVFSGHRSNHNAC